MARKIRWGIVGTGMIADVFAGELKQSKWGVAEAVGSRTTEKARAFAAKHDIPHPYGSYEELLADPSVEAVYVATPHPAHRAVVVAAARAGKHILCEKPLGVTPEGCREMIAAANDAGVVLLEAFMYRLHPQTRRILSLVREGAIGDVRVIRTTFCFGLGNAYNVRLDRNLRGGGLYDVGCYCVNFSRMIAGAEPDQTSAAWILGDETGVDETLAGLLRFPNGTLAHFDVSIRSAGSAYAEILGSEGSIHVPSPWKPHPEKAEFELRRKGKPPEKVTILNGGKVFALEADHMAEVIAGDAEPLIPASDALGNVTVLDAIWRSMHA